MSGPAMHVHGAGEDALRPEREPLLTVRMELAVGPLFCRSPTRPGDDAGQAPPPSGTRTPRSGHLSPDTGRLRRDLQPAVAAPTDGRAPASVVLPSRLGVALVGLRLLGAA